MRPRKAHQDRPALVLIGPFEYADVARKCAGHRRLQRAAAIVDPVDRPPASRRFEEAQAEPDESLPEIGAVFVLVAEPAGEGVAYAVRVEFLPLIRSLQPLHEVAIVYLPAPVEEIECASLILGLLRLIDGKKPRIR